MKNLRTADAILRMMMRDFWRWRWRKDIRPGFRLACWVFPVLIFSLFPVYLFTYATGLVMPIYEQERILERARRRKANLKSD